MCPGNLILFQQFCCISVKILAFYVSLQEGDTSLMLAAERGHVRVVKKLVKAGAKLDLQNRVCVNTSSALSVDAVYVCEISSWDIET